MAENVEEIEAKLAAYVDGELTPAERVEIETHLVNNPSHRELLADLVLHRNLLRSLPREKAPGDCTEGFQGQLERDILLGGDELAHARRRWRIQYSPQLLSAAAIILVAVTLGIIVYTVLPPHQSHPPISQLSTEPSKDSEPAVSETTGTLTDSRSFKIAPDGALGKKSAADPNWNFSKEAALGQKLETSHYAGVQQQAEQQQLAGDMMVITVTADDVKSANDAVVSYLALNKIPFTSEADGTWKDGVDVLATARRVVTGGEPGGAGGPRGGSGPGASLSASAAQTPALQTDENLVAKREEGLVRERVEVARVEAKTSLKAAPAQVEEKRLDEKTVQVDALKQERFAKDGSEPAQDQPARNRAPTTQPTALARGGNETDRLDDTVRRKGSYGGYGGAFVGGGGFAGGGVLIQQQQQQIRTLSLADADSVACVVIARDMNGQQVRELAKSLSQPERNLYTTVQYDRAGSSTSATSGTYARVNANELTASVLADQQQRPLSETEVMFKEKALATNTPAIVAPATRPAAAAVTLNIRPDEAGLSRGETESKTANGTLPNEGKFQYGVDLSEPVQQKLIPAQQPADYFGAPTTQPLAPLAGGRRADTFTCVIVVQNSATARSGPATTQPIAGKPATTAPVNPPPEAAKEAK